MNNNSSPGISDAERLEILQNLPVGVVCLNRRGTLLYLNDRAGSILGGTAEALLGEDFFADDFGWGDECNNLYAGTSHPLHACLNGEDGKQERICSIFCHTTQAVTVRLTVPERESGIGNVTVYLDVVPAKNSPAVSEDSILHRLEVREAALNCSLAPVVIASLDGTITYVNEVFLEVWRYDSPEEVVGREPESVWDEWYRVTERLPELIDRGELYGELVGIRKDKSRFMMRFHALVFKGAEGRPERLLASFSDISENLELRSERDLAIELQHLLSSEYDLRETMQLVTRKMQQWSGCEAIGIRLKDGDDYPYFETRGFPAEFVALERTLCYQDSAGIPVINGDSGNPMLECICGRVLMGQTDPEQPFFTDEGSFWYNNADTLLRDARDSLLNTRLRNRCINEGFLSLALIPLKAEGRIYGLIQLNEKRRNHFTREMVGTFEYLASIIALGLIQKRYQQQLLESEAKYRNYIEHSPNAVFIMDDRGVVLEMNPATSLLTGYSEEELLGKCFTDFSAGDQDQLLERFQELLDRKMLRQKMFSSIKKDGTPAYWSVDLALLPGGNIIGFGQDITESFKAEQRYLELFDNIPSGVAVYQPVEGGRNFRIVDVNRSVELIEGVRREDIIGRKVTAVFAGARDFGMLDLMKQVSESGETGYLPVSLYSDKRISGWRENIVYRLPSGEIVNIYQDVTEKKVAEHALRESEAKLRAAFNAARNVAFVTVDPSGTECILDFSPGAERVFGYSREDILGYGFFTLFPEDVRKHVRERFVHVIRTGEGCSEEVLLLNSKGDCVPALCSLHPILDVAGQVSHLLLVSIDISERKRAEEALRKSEEHLRLMFSAALDVSFVQVSLSDGAILEFSPGAEKLYGYTKEEVLGNNIGLFIPDQNIAALPQIMEQVRAGGVWSTQHTTMKHKSGREIPISLTIYPLPGAEGVPSAALGVSADISVQLEAENKIRKNLLEKESLLKEIHHRVKNNLNIVTSLLNLQAMRFEEDSPLQNALSEAINRIRSMAMVHERLYHSHDLSEINLREHVTFLVDELRAVLLEGSSIRLEADVANVGINIEKAIPCSIIITELVTNAVKHAFPDGGSGTIRVDTDPECRNELVLSVSDDGIGLPGDLDFDKGGNLGFELIRVLIKQLHGSVSIESDSGTRISISFQLH